MTNIIGVVFGKDGKPSFYNALDNVVNEKDKVVIQRENGLFLGEVVSTNVSLIGDKSVDDIVRVATKEDISNNEKNIKSAKEALVKAKEIALKNNLNMNIIDASFNLDKSQLLFLFLSDVRIDFREMAKELASIYKTRIELRQIGARDKARDVSGIGQCGCELCCSRFLCGSMDAVSINMAKNQNLSLNPSKINGQCGRLLCCLKYEDDVYSENRSKVPQIGDVMNTKAGKGEVISLNILKQSYVIKLDDDTTAEILINE